MTHAVLFDLAQTANSTLDKERYDSGVFLSLSCLDVTAFLFAPARSFSI